MELRDAGERDLEGILEIFNQVIADTTAVWRDDPVDMEERRAWFEARRDRGYPILVAVEGDEVVGFASYGDFRVGSGYRFSVEHSVHVRDRARGQGIGRALMEALIERAQAGGIRSMIAGIDAETEGSLEFHRSLGFEQVGRIPAVGRKFDRWVDLVLLQRRL